MGKLSQLEVPERDGTNIRRERERAKFVKDQR